MSTFRGPGVPAQAGAPHSPVMYNQPLGAHHPHSQHSPAIQNDTIVGKAMQTMFTSTEMFTPTVSIWASNAKLILTHHWHHLMLCVQFIEIGDRPNNGTITYSNTCHSSSINTCKFTTADNITIPTTNRSTNATTIDDNVATIDGEFNFCNRINLISMIITFRERFSQINRPIHTHFLINLKFKNYGYVFSPRIA